jgi:outer membrane protein assembly factor BamD (BamD/ComL family)
MLLRYSDFLRENVEVYQTDDPSLASRKNLLNDLEKQSKEFLQKRIELDNIYITYKDEGDLINKLSARGFIKKTGNKKNIEFENPLLSIYSGASQKSRTLKDIEKSIEELKGRLKDKNDYLQKNPNSKESVGSEIETLNKELEEKNKQIQKISNEIVQIQRVSNERLKEITKNFKDTNRQVRSELK